MNWIWITLRNVLKLFIENCFVIINIECLTWILFYFQRILLFLCAYACLAYGHPDVSHLSQGYDYPKPSIPFEPSEVRPQVLPPVVPKYLPPPQPTPPPVSIYLLTIRLNLSFLSRGLIVGVCRQVPLSKKLAFM